MSVGSSNQPHELECSSYPGRQEEASETEDKRNPTKAGPHLLCLFTAWGRSRPGAFFLTQEARPCLRGELGCECELRWGG